MVAKYCFPRQHYYYHCCCCCLLFCRKNSNIIIPITLRGCPAERIQLGQASFSSLPPVCSSIGQPSLCLSQPTWTEPADHFELLHITPGKMILHHGELRLASGCRTCSMDLFLKSSRFLPFRGLVIIHRFLCIRINWP